MPAVAALRSQAPAALPRQCLRHARPAWRPASAPGARRRLPQLRASQGPSSERTEASPGSKGKTANEEMVPLVQELTDTSKLGQRGELWVVAQFAALFLVALPPPLLQGPVRAAGAALIAGGLAIIVAGQQALRDNLTPLPQPRQGSELVTSGIYSACRHPMYGGLVAASLGLAVLTSDDVRLLFSGVVFLVLDNKASYEERLLVERYGQDYEQYRRATKKLLPYIY